jgi:hypothetical protein
VPVHGMLIQAVLSESDCGDDGCLSLTNVTGGRILAPIRWGWSGLCAARPQPGSLFQVVYCHESLKVSLFGLGRDLGANNVAGSVFAVFKVVSTHVPACTHDGAIEFGLLVKLLSCKLFPLFIVIEFEVHARLFVCDNAFCHQLLALLLLLVALPFLCGPLVLIVIVVCLSLLTVETKAGGMR